MNPFASLESDGRREVLRGYGLKHGLNILVETGTNDGGTPWALKDAFKEIHTIELGHDQWKAATRRFASYPHVHCLQGDSSKVLPAVLKKIREPALFWLDGHYSGGITAHGDRSTPIREELALIFADDKPHVILVDDARIFEGGPEHDMYDHYADYPSIGWVREQAEQNDYSFWLQDDIIRLEPAC